MRVDITNPWYPYGRVQDSYYDLRGSELIPRKICDYIIDAPVGAYQPADDNDLARCRLWKYLYYDGARPLNESLPTIEQKMSVVFDPESPENPPTEKGYRLFPQVFVKQAQTDAQTRLMVHMGRTIPSTNEFTMSISVVFTLFTHYTYESNTKTDAYSRLFAMEQALIEAFHGVNMDGVGVFFMSRGKHPDCGSREIYDGNTNIGREVTMALEIATVSPQGMTEMDNMAGLSSGGSLW